MKKISKRYRRQRFKNENPQSLRDHIFHVSCMVIIPWTTCFCKCLRRSKLSIYLYLHIVPSRVCLCACGCLQRDNTWKSMAPCSEGQQSWAIWSVTFAAHLQGSGSRCLSETRVWWSYLEKRLQSFRTHVTPSSLGLLCEGFLNQHQLVLEVQWLTYITQQLWILLPWETSTAHSQVYGQAEQSQLVTHLPSITLPRNSPLHHRWQLSGQLNAC